MVSGKYGLAISIWLWLINVFTSPYRSWIETYSVQSTLRFYGSSRPLYAACERFQMPVEQAESCELKLLA